MVAGVSTACFYPELTERALDCLADYGIKTAEVFLNSPSEIEPGFLRALRNVADGAGMRICSIHPFTSGLEPLLFFSDYRRRFLDGLEWYKRYFEAANILGAPIMVFHGDRREASKPRSRYFDLFGELAEEARKMGVTVAQENVSRCASYCPQFFKEMSRYLPDARYVLDTKQALRGGFTAQEMAQAMSGRIIHLHVSDYNDLCDCLPIGEGQFNFSGFLQQVFAEGFDGNVILELYRHNYGDYRQLHDSYLTIAQTISSLNGEKNL